jgi:hypothetical protein
MVLYGKAPRAIAEEFRPFNVRAHEDALSIGSTHNHDGDGDGVVRYHLAADSREFRGTVFAWGSESDAADLAKLHSGFRSHLRASSSSVLAAPRRDVARCGSGPLTGVAIAVSGLSLSQHMRGVEPGGLKPLLYVCLFYRLRSMNSLYTCNASSVASKTKQCFRAMRSNQRMHLTVQRRRCARCCPAGDARRLGLAS